MRSFFLSRLVTPAYEILSPAQQPLLAATRDATCCVSTGFGPSVCGLRPSLSGSFPIQESLTCLQSGEFRSNCLCCYSHWHSASLQAQCPLASARITTRTRTRI